MGVEVEKDQIGGNWNEQESSRKHYNWIAGTEERCPLDSLTGGLGTHAGQKR